MQPGDAVRIARELRQNASEVLRWVEAGESVRVTVNGREVAEIVPVQRKRWRTWGEIEAFFTGPPDANWERQRWSISQSAIRGLVTIDRSPSGSSQ